MNKQEKYIDARNEILKSKGIYEPEKLENFTDEIYQMMKDRDFSIIEAETIVKYLSMKIMDDKKIILREPLKSLDRFNKEG